MCSQIKKSPRKLLHLFSLHGLFLVLLILGSCFLIADLQTTVVVGFGILVGLAAAAIGLISDRSTSFQFSIRGLLALITAVAIFAVMQQHWFISPEAAIARIQQMGGDADILEGPNGKQSRAELIELEISPRGLNYLRSLPTLRHLDLDYTEVGDVGMKYIGKLTDLEWLDIEDTAVTDNGLKYLSNLQNLQRIIVDSNEITDEGLMHLSDLKSLRSVRMLNTKVSEKGIEAFNRKLPGCQVTIRRNQRVRASPN